MSVVSFLLPWTRATSGRICISEGATLGVTSGGSGIGDGRIGLDVSPLDAAINGTANCDCRNAPRKPV